MAKDRSKRKGPKGARAGSERAKVQVMSSWTRTSPGAVGTMGAGFGFITGGDGASGHVPLPSGVTSHTHALLHAVSRILGSFPPTVELEFEITHRMLVLTFAHFGSAAEEVAAAVAFIRRRLTDGKVASQDVLDAFASNMLARKARTFFSMCQGAGRYMTREMSEMRPPGEVAAKRVEALEHGAFVIFRAVGRDDRMSDENDDLLEVRWAGLFGRGGIVFQDRFRDITPDEMWALHAWGTALSKESGEGAEGPEALWSPLCLADEDPGIFWSCVRHAMMEGWPGALLGGRAESWKTRDRISQERGCCDLEFPVEQRGAVAVQALMEVQRMVQRLPGFAKGMKLTVVNSASEKGSLMKDAGDLGDYERFMKMMEAMQTMPDDKREELLSRLQKEEEKEAQKEERRKAHGRPDVRASLIGQSLCCWSCGNREMEERALMRCPLCTGHLCAQTPCMLAHRRHCLSREPEAEDSLPHGGAVECVVLPGDQSIKPYQRMLPRRVSAATQMLAEVLQCEKLLELTPHRAFQGGLSDVLEGNWQMRQRGLRLVQADWASSLYRAPVEIGGLTSAGGRKLNGQTGTLGSYHGERDRWEVACGPGQPKLMKGFNLTARGAPLKLAPQNLRASTILTPLHDNNTFGDDGFAQLAGGFDNRFVCGEQEVGARARGDVWVLRVDADSLGSAEELVPFRFSDFERLWGIFQYVPMPGERFAAGTVMRKDPDTEQMLGEYLRRTFYGDAEDASDDEADEESVLDKLELWDWALAQAEEEPEPLVGAVVEILGLKTAQHYNGACGRILAAGERLQVKLFSPHDRVLKVSRDNVILDRLLGEGPVDPEAGSGDIGWPAASDPERSQAAEESDAGQLLDATLEPEAEHSLEALPSDEERPQTAESVGAMPIPESSAGDSAAIGSAVAEAPQVTASAAAPGPPPPHVQPSHAPVTLGVPLWLERPLGSQFFCAPGELRFSQDTVRASFRSGFTIRETLEQLLSGDIRKRDVEMMRVVLHDGCLYSLSNRRLALYRLLSMAGRCKRVKVELVRKGADFWRKFTTRNRGEQVVIRETMEVVGRDARSTTFQYGRIGGASLANSAARRQASASGP